MSTLPLLFLAFCPVQWDAPRGQNINRGFGITGWNRPDSLPPLDPKFNFDKAKKEAIERIKDQQKKVGGVEVTME